MNISYPIVAIASAMFAAIASIFAKSLLSHIPAKRLIGTTFLIMAGTLVVFSPLFYLFEANTLSISLLLSIAIIDTVANYFYFKTFEYAEASIATPLLSLAPTFTFFFGIVILRQVDSPITYIAGGGILLLILLFSIDFDQFHAFKSNVLFPGIMSSLLFGLSAIPTKLLLDTYHAINPPTLYMYRSILIGIFASIVYRSSRTLTLSQYGSLFVRSLFVIAQWLLLYIALSQGSAGISMTLGNITPIFVFFLSVLFLKEKATVKKIITSLLILLLSLVIARSH